MIREDSNLKGSGETISPGLWGDRSRPAGDARGAAPLWGANDSERQVPVLSGALKTLFSIKLLGLCLYWVVLDCIGLHIICSIKACIKKPHRLGEGHLDLLIVFAYLLPFYF